MSPIIDLGEGLLEIAHLARRIPVKGVRNGKWRTRVVDHESENGVSAVTWPRDRIVHQTGGALLMRWRQASAASCGEGICGRPPGAYGCIPVKVQHHVYSWATFSFEGHAKASCHYGMPFGAVSACWTYYRYGLS